MTTPNSATTNWRSRARALRILHEEVRREREEAAVHREQTCGQCGWSWFVGRDGWLLCGNPESPYYCDTVPVDLSCLEHGASQDDGKS